MSQAIATSVKQRLNELAIETEKTYKEKVKKNISLDFSRIFDWQIDGKQYQKFRTLG